MIWRRGVGNFCEKWNFCGRASARIFEDVTKIGMAVLGDVGYWYFISHSFLYEVIRLSAI